MATRITGITGISGNTATKEPVVSRNQIETSGYDTAPIKSAKDQEMSLPCPAMRGRNPATRYQLWAKKLSGI